MISIDTKLLGLCDDCTEFEPKMISSNRYTNELLYCVDVCVTCENYAKCKRLQDMFKERYAK